MEINGTEVAAAISGPFSCDWKEVKGVWNSGGSATATLVLREVGGVAMGNDFALDDIALYKLIPLEKEVTITVNKVDNAGAIGQVLTEGTRL